MPGSVRENDHFVQTFVDTHHVSSILDVGTGQGTYADLLMGRADRIDGIEVWKPYIRDYDLNEKYSYLWHADARKILSALAEDVLDVKAYDLVIFGDVMEHMTKEEALTCWDDAGKIATWGLISVPIIHYPQGAEGGNPYEVHVQDHLTPERVREMFGPFEYEMVYNITGTFVKRFS